MLEVRVQDSSRNGTFVNGKRVGAGDSMAVEDGDIIALVAVPVQNADGTFSLPGDDSNSDEKAWAQLTFGDMTTVDLTSGAGVPFVMGRTAEKCIGGRVVVDQRCVCVYVCIRVCTCVRVYVYVRVRATPPNLICSSLSDKYRPPTPTHIARTHTTG
jgi:hypothetical protein